MATQTLDRYSVSSLPIELFRDKIKLADATCFFTTRNTNQFLVTNWHVFSGRNSHTGQSINKNGAVPNRASIPIHKKNMLGSWAPSVEFRLTDALDNPLWLQHSRGQEIDLACLKIDSLPDGLIAYDVISENNADDMIVSVSTEVFIVGFPTGMPRQEILPIWKRGSIASEPDLDFDGLPYVLVDTATREGMSGSPVYARTRGGYAASNGVYKMGGGTNTKFVGIYSGRHGSSEEISVQLGRVWKSAALEEMLSNPVQGNYEIISI